MNRLASRIVWPESSEMGPLKDRHGRSHGQFFGFGPISVCRQKLTMAASINVKSVTKPNGVVRNDYGPGVTSEATVVMLQRSATWPEF
jgi:hypothetical protein